MSDRIKATITESELERMVDSMVQRRLATDVAYLYAEDAEAQSSREEQITEEVVSRLQERYEVSP